MRTVYKESTLYCTIIPLFCKGVKEMIFYIKDFYILDDTA